MKLQTFYNQSEGLRVYKLGETPEKLASLLGIPESQVLKLNANENLFIPNNFVKNILREALEETDPRLYPLDEMDRLKEALGKYLNISSDQIMVGAGGDQLIELVLQAFLRTGKEMLAVTPTFSMYGRTALKMGAKYKTVDLDVDFSLNFGKVISKVTSETRLLTLCSPNNPTGNQFKRETILHLAEEFQGLIVVDEAYAEYARHNMVEDTAEFDNLLILRTFSKAFGLAGLRLGYAIANPDLIKVLEERYQQPYPVSSIALRAGLKFLERVDVVLDSVEAAKKERARLVEKINELVGVTAYPSETNFVLFTTHRDTGEIYCELLKKGIIVRKIGPVPGSRGCLRVSIAPREKMNRFLKAIKETLE